MSLRMHEDKTMDLNIDSEVVSFKVFPTEAELKAEVREYEAQYAELCSQKLSLEALLVPEDARKVRNPSLLSLTRWVRCRTGRREVGVGFQKLGKFVFSWGEIQAS
jgi:hypothetical protein